MGEQRYLTLLVCPEAPVIFNTFSWPSLPTTKMMGLVLIALKRTGLFPAQCYQWLGLGLGVWLRI